MPPYGIDYKCIISTFAISWNCVLDLVDFVHQVFSLKPQQGSSKQIKKLFFLNCFIYDVIKLLLPNYGVTVMIFIS